LGLYRIHEQIADQGAITYRGVVESSQKPVYIHLIPQDVTTEEKRRILSRLQRRLSLAAGSNGLLDVRHEGAQLYAITEIISGFTNFSDWLNQEAPEVMRAPLTNTVDHLIAQFGDPKPPTPPIVQNKRDYVAEIFAPPLLATDIRGQRTGAPAREGYSPPVDPRPGLYTMVVDPGKKTTGSHPIPPPTPAPPPPPAPDPAAATQQTRIAVLESQVGMWKMAAIAACVLAGLCLLFTFILLMRNK